MAPARRDGQLSLNSVIYDIVVDSYNEAELGPRPAPVREGSPGTAGDNDNSVVGWNDWSEGGFAVTYAPNDPNRAGEVKDCIIDVPYQITLSMLQQAATGVDEAPTKIAQLVAGGRMTAISATKVWLKDAAGEGWTAMLTGVTPKDIIAWGDGTNTLYLVAMGTNAYQYSVDTMATWTVSNLGSNSQIADFFAVGSAATGTSGGTLWKAVKPNLVYASSNPKNGGAWTSAYTVGGSETNITGMAVIEDRLLVAKEEGVYWIKPDGTVQFLIDLRQAVSATNGNAMIGWGGYVFVNWLQGLFQLSGRNLLNVGEVTASFRDVGPHVGNQEGGDVRGRVVAMCGSPTRLYTVLRSESDNYSINRYNGNPVPGHGWNPGFAWLGSTACNAIGWEQPTSGNPRLYFGFGAAIKYMVMPRFGDNPLLDSAARYSASGTAILPEHESPYRAMTKSELYEALDAERLATGSRYVDVSYKIDDEGTIAWETLGRFETTGIARKYFSTTENGRRIKLRLSLATDDSTNTPRIRMLEHHYELRPTLRRKWQFQVILGGSPSHQTRTAANTITALEAARASSNPVPFVDRFGGVWDVFVMQLGHVEYVKLPGAPEPVGVAAVTVHEYKSGVGAYYVGAENALVGSAYAA